MENAGRKARKTFDAFIAALRSAASDQSRFAVKMRFAEGDVVEHIWLAGVSFDGSVFSGRIGNNPVDLKQVRLGRKVSIRPGEISDWMYIENGRLVGGYTIRLMCEDMSPKEKEQFETEINCRIK